MYKKHPIEITLLKWPIFPLLHTCATYNFIGKIALEVHSFFASLSHFLPPVYKYHMKCSKKRVCFKCINGFFASSLEHFIYGSSSSHRGSSAKLKGALSFENLSCKLNNFLPSVRKKGIKWKSAAELAACENKSKLATATSRPLFQIPPKTFQSLLSQYTKMH